MVRFVVVALVAIAAVACSRGPSTAEECVSEYGKQAATKGLVRAAYSFCGTAYSEKAHPIEVSRAKCMVDQLPALKTEAALGVVSNECAAKFPTPECPLGTRFSFADDGCKDICPRDHLYLPGQYPECEIDPSKVKWD